MKDKKLPFDRKCHVLYSCPCKKEILKEHPEYRDAAGFRRNK